MMMEKIKHFGVFGLLVFLALSCGDKNKPTPNPTPDPCVSTSLQVSASVNDRQVTATASGGTAPYIYSMNGVSYVSTNVFSDLANATYTVYVKDNAGCVKTTQVTVNYVEEDPANSFRDSRDNQLYLTVQVGNQVWMKENLNYETASNSYCYDNNAAKCEEFGRLYTYEVATTVCPSGWHLPNQAEWDVLLAHVGGYVGNAYKVKEGGSTGLEIKIGSGGRRADNGTFVGSSLTALWVADSEAGGNVSNYQISVSQDIDKYIGTPLNAYSVRCIKD
jgi:uncharacterized protein (TIGR02145 family)